MRPKVVRYDDDIFFVRRVIFLCFFAHFFGVFAQSTIWTAFTPLASWPLGSIVAFTASIYCLRVRRRIVVVRTCQYSSTAGLCGTYCPPRRSPLVWSVWRYVRDTAGKRYQVPGTKIQVLYYEDTEQNLNIWSGGWIIARYVQDIHTIRIIRRIIRIHVILLRMISIWYPRRTAAVPDRRLLLFLWPWTEHTDRPNPSAV